MNEEVIKQLRNEMPAIFAGKKVDDYTGGAVCWRTIQNLKFKNEFPKEILFRMGKRDVIKRDLFLEWLIEKYG